jgi:hypothetical protein
MQLPPEQVNAIVIGSRSCMFMAPLWKSNSMSETPALGTVIFS